MPKIKTNRGAAKRFKVTATGKILGFKAYGSHIMTKKTRKRKRGLRGSEVLDETNAKNIRRIIPYL